jgi:lysophospholipase L1-like esterase
MKRTLLMPLVAVLAAFAAEINAAPEYKPQPAIKVQPRGGIGNVLAKIRAGEEVAVAYLGGSITAANGWRPGTTAWLAEKYPGAKFKEIHAAIGGTGSDLGAFRVGRDALQHDPDLLFVEFAVNDGGAAPEAIWRQMEGIVRQTWRRDPQTDILFVYTIAANMTNDVAAGMCPRSSSAMEMLAEHYAIPSVNFAVPVVELLNQGKLVFTAAEKPNDGKIWFAKDSCHPNPEGHEIYVELLKRAWSEMESLKPVDHADKLSGCFVEDHWEAAKMVPLEESMLSGNWRKLTEEDSLQKRFGSRMGQIWRADRPGSAVQFKFRGRIARLYDLLGPDGGQVIVAVNGKSSDKPVPRFDSYCTYHRIASLGVVSGDSMDQVHEVRVEIHPEQPSRQPVAFRLKDPEKELAEEKFQGSRIWVSQLMLLGDLVR